MKNKKLIVKEIEYNFFYDDHINMWRLIESPNFINGQFIDLEIDLSNFSDQVNWQEVEGFIESMSNNNLLFKERIEDAKDVLKSLFKSIYKNAYDKDFYDSIKFNISGIDFKGYCKNVNLGDKFEFDYFFFPQYSKDPYKDIGSFVWRANFRDTVLLGVYCDRI